MCRRRTESDIHSEKQYARREPPTEKSDCYSSGTLVTDERCWRPRLNCTIWAEKGHFNQILMFQDRCVRRSSVFLRSSTATRVFTNDQSERVHLQTSSPRQNWPRQQEIHSSKKISISFQNEASISSTSDTCTCETAMFWSLGALEFMHMGLEQVQINEQSIKNPLGWSFIVQCLEFCIIRT